MRADKNLDGVGVGFAGADTHGVVEAGNENLAVADLSGFAAVEMAATTLST